MLSYQGRVPNSKTEVHKEGVGGGCEVCGVMPHGVQDTGSSSRSPSLPSLEAADRDTGSQSSAQCGKE